MDRIRRRRVPPEGPQAQRLLLGPTHEEFFTLTVKGEYSSYKDFPLPLFQIQTKYRDEARPRAGILRGREFVMEDSYSFDVDDEGLKRAVRRAPRGVPTHLRPTGRCVRHRLCGVRGDGRERVGGVPRRKRRGEDTFVRCEESGSPPTSRRSHRRPGGAANRRLRRRPRLRHPGHPDDRHLVEWANGGLGRR